MMKDLPLWSLTLQPVRLKKVALFTLQLTQVGFLLERAARLDAILQNKKKKAPRKRKAGEEDVRWNKIKTAHKEYC